MSPDKELLRTVKARTDEKKIVWRYRYIYIYIYPFIPEVDSSIFEFGHIHHCKQGIGQKVKTN